MKKWFKVWASILTDVGFQNMGLEDMGRWLLLGAWICQQGDNGKVKVIPPANWVLSMFRCVSLEALKVALMQLPNVQITPPLNDNGDFIVTIRHWFKYQVDSTASERVKRSRYKRRGEETLTSTSTSTPSPPLRSADTTRRSGSERRGSESDPESDREVDYEKLEAQARNEAWRKAGGPSPGFVPPDESDFRAIKAELMKVRQTNGCR